MHKHKQNNPHKQSLRTEPCGVVFGEVAEYKTDDWTHVQLGGDPGAVQLCDLFGRELALFKTTIQAIENGGKAKFEGGTDHVTFEKTENGRFRLFLRPVDGRPVLRIYPTIVSSETLMFY